ncbi:MAG: aldehyde dehydrogenase family protein, partial [Betaproteobacteria bacterium]|nr:aldehyde dehydrogenase family protein [Betaproteobacteria bacterium]
MTLIEECMRINGERVRRAHTLAVHNPYTNDFIGRVPKAQVDDVRRAFEVAAAYRPRLTRYERSNILRRAAEVVMRETQRISDLITLESGLCKQDSVYEAGRVRDVLLFGADAVLHDDAQVFSCDITPHGRQRRVYTQRDPLLGVISAITPFNHPMNQVAHKI